VTQESSKHMSLSRQPEDGSRIESRNVTVSHITQMTASATATARPQFRPSQGIICVATVGLGF
jgi:hypothetical protein